MGILSNENQSKTNETNSGVNNHDVEVEDQGQLINENNTFNMNMTTIAFSKESMIMMTFILLAIIAIVVLIVIIIAKSCRK